MGKGKGQSGVHVVRADSPAFLCLNTREFLIIEYRASMAQMGSSAFDTLSFASSSSSASNSSFRIGAGASASDNADKVLIWSMRKVMYDVTELFDPKSRRRDEIFDAQQEKGKKRTRREGRVNYPW